MVKKKKSKIKKILKESTPTIVVKKLEPNIILNEENKFFKGDFANEKMRFFSE